MRALLQSVAFAAAWVAVSGAVALCQPAPATSPGAGARKSPPSIRLLIGDIVGQQSHKDAPGSVEPDIGRFQGALASIAMADGEHVWTRCQHDQEFENVHFMDEENLTPKLDSQSLETLRKNQIDYFVLLLFSQNAGKLRVTARLEENRAGQSMEYRCSVPGLPAGSR